MKNNDVNEISRELLIYSLQPQRFRFFVKLVRKILWRFVRPFHFYQIQKFHQLLQEKNFIINNLSQMSDLQGQMIGCNDQRIGRQDQRISCQDQLIDRLNQLTLQQNKMLTQLEEKLCKIEDFIQSNQRNIEILNPNYFDEKMKIFSAEMKFELMPLINRIVHLESENKLLKSNMERIANIKRIKDDKC